MNILHHMKEIKLIMIHLNLTKKKVPMHLCLNQIQKDSHLFYKQIQDQEVTKRLIF